MRKRHKAGPGKAVAPDGDVERRLRALEQEVQELRAVSRRLADVVDVVTELLVPAMDRDDERVRAALDRLRPGGDE